MAAKKKGKKNTEKQKSPVMAEVIFLIILVIAALILISLFGLGGVVGRSVSGVLFGLFGVLAYLFPFLLVVLGGLVISNAGNVSYRRKIWYGLGFYLSLCGLVQWFFNDSARDVWETYVHASKYHTRGGFFGGLLSFELSKLIGSAGDLVLLIGLLLLFFILFSRKLIFHSMQRGVENKRSRYQERKQERELEEENDDSVERRGMKVHRFEHGLREEAEAHATKKDKKKLSPNLKEEKKTDSVEKPVKNRRHRKNVPETATMESVKPSLPETEEEKALKNIHIMGMHEEKQPDSTASPVFEKELQAKFGKKSKKAPEPETIEPENNETENVSAPVPVPDPAPAPIPVTESVLPKTEVSEADTSLEKKESEQPAPEEKDKPEPPKEIPYVFPPLDLLSRPKSGAHSMSEKELKETALKLQEALRNFNVNVSLGDISVGPSVTRYEIIPDQGVKVKSITALADDIKLSLAAQDIRIEAPIPGKSAVGIEVPNANRVTITLRELLESEEFQKSKSKVSFAVGKDISGKTIVTDIAKMPHLLVAGSTGSGKSVLINTLIMSIIFKANPNEVKLIMVDPKMVEFMAFAQIPHLMIPVVDDPKKASAALAWAVAEMEKRYKAFAELGIRDISTYNKKIERMKGKDDPAYQRMPQIVIIVDEFADLMMVASHDVEDSVMRLAQKARAAGIHLVLATQRPSVNVITGVIKANIPSRIALSVSSQTDSRTIIDSMGAEKLLGNGDMLFAPQSLPKPIRVQGAFVSDDDRDKVVTFLKEHGGAAYDEEVTASIETVQTEAAKGSSSGAEEAPVFGSDRDEKFEEAGRFIIEKNKASIGALQRKFSTGFNRAARIMDQLADAGVVGPEVGTKAREILMTMEEFEAYLNQE